ncbi:putative ubiquitinyl hydrolase 1 [Helianthus anomalus]
MILPTPPPIDVTTTINLFKLMYPHSELAAAEGYQPAEETANSVDAPKVDDPPSERFTWTIENFSKMTHKKVYSDVFVVGGYKWYVLF